MSDCKKDDENGKQEDIAIICTENIPNWNQLKSTSSWINIDLTDYLREISYSILLQAPSIKISKSDIMFKNGKGEAIIFDKDEKRIPQVNFAIDAIDG